MGNISNKRKIATPTTLFGKFRSSLSASVFALSTAMSGLNINNQNISVPNIELGIVKELSADMRKRYSNLFRCISYNRISSSFRRSSCYF